MSEATRNVALEREDASARRAAQSVFDRPVVLEAGAGTGKTTTLVARIAAWCLGPGWSRAENALRAEGADAPDPARTAVRALGGVVAITFTEAAAAEMSRRIGESLFQIEAGALPVGLDEDLLDVEPDARRLRAAALRGALDHLVAQTIHAYCRRLLVSFPLDAGLHPRLVIDADQRRQTDVVREVLEEVSRTAYADPGDPDLRALADLGVGPRELEEELLGLLKEGLTADALARDPLAPDTIAGFCEALLTGLARFREAADGRLAQVSGAKLPRELDALLESLQARLGAELPRTPEALAALEAEVQDRWDEGHLKRLRAWGQGKFGVRESEALGDRAERLMAPAAELAEHVGVLLSLDVQRLACAARVIGRLLRTCEERMRARGFASFGELLTGASRLLTEKPAVADRARARIDQLLVDEFQDTDSRQCDLVRALALSGAPEQRPGLFVVGDPKQSIYGWRNADLVAYDAFVDDVRAVSGSVLRLSVNYRSAPQILDEVERVVAPVMRPCAGLQPPFQPLAPHAGNPSAFDDGAAAVEYWVAADPALGGGTRAARAAQIEAEALARDLRRLHDENAVAWSDFGVLFRSRGEWETYLRALRDAGIPHAVEGDRHYHRRREIADAVALVCSALDPNDHVSLVAWLRSSAVGVPDAAWIPLWAEGFPGQLSGLTSSDPESLAKLRETVARAASELGDDVPGIERVRGWEQGLCAALEALADIREHFPREPADRFVERLRSRTLLEASESARYAGVWRAANLDRFFRRLAEELDSDGPGAVVRRLRRAIAQEEEEEDSRPVEIVEDAVRILTFHGAKGLDFEHVYLMQLHKGRAAADDARVGSAGGALLGYKLLGAPSLDWGRVRRGRREVEEAECVRLLYVGMTRAKRRLVLSGVWPGFQASVSPGQMVALLAERSEPPPDLEATLQRLADAGGLDAVDVGQARWVFPGLIASAPIDAGPPRREEVQLATPAQAAEASARLRAECTRAAAHAARPLGGAASAQAYVETAEERAERAFGGAGFRARSGANAQVSETARASARSVGTAIHRVLEDFDFEAPLDAELARRRQALEHSLARDLQGDVLDRARRDAGELFDRMAQGALLEKLRELAPHFVARELPVLGRPGEADEPVGFVSGAIDLVYCDPESDELVVVDYKTDDLDGVSEAELGERRDGYARQGEAYQRALREALALDYTPRFELWYLRHDRVESASTASP